MRVVLWILCLLIIVVPCIVLAKAPDQYTPLVAFLLSVAVAFVAVLASRKEFLDEAAKDTQTEWLTQAESACDSLLTTISQITRLREYTLGTCDDAAASMPELQQNNMKAVRTLIERNCQSTGSQLYDISQHLECAISDWKRFIRKNCVGKECDQINNRLKERRIDLMKPVFDKAKNPSQSCSGTFNEHVASKVGGA